MLCFCKFIDYELFKVTLLGGGNPVARVGRGCRTMEFGGFCLLRNGWNVNIQFTCVHDCFARVVYSCAVCGNSCFFSAR